VACMNCIVAVYLNNELCVLKRVEVISESPGSARQLNESRFGRNTHIWILFIVTTGHLRAAMMLMRSLVKTILAHPLLSFGRSVWESSAQKH